MSREFAFPGTRPRYAPDRVVDIQHIALALEVDPAKRQVSGTATLRGMVIAPGTKLIAPLTVELAITKVTVGGKAAPVGHDGKRLRVELPAALATGAEVSLAIDNSGAPRRGVY